MSVPIQEAHGVRSQKTALLIVTTVKTPNLTSQLLVVAVTYMQAKLGK
jgi:hypothetical protein